MAKINQLKFEVEHMFRFSIKLRSQIEKPDERL